MDYIAAIIFSRSRYLHRHTNGNKLTDIISKSTPITSTSEFESHNYVLGAQTLQINVTDPGFTGNICLV